MTNVRNPICGCYIYLDHIKAVEFSLASVTPFKGGRRGDQISLLGGIYGCGRTAKGGILSKVLHARLDLAKNIGVILFRNDIDLILSRNKVSLVNAVSVEKKVARGGILSDPSTAEMVGKRAVLARQ